MQCSVYMHNVQYIHWKLCIYSGEHKECHLLSALRGEIWSQTLYFIVRELYPCFYEFFDVTILTYILFLSNSGGMFFSSGALLFIPIVYFYHPYYWGKTQYIIIDLFIFRNKGCSCCIHFMFILWITTPHPQGELSCMNLLLILLYTLYRMKYVQIKHPTPLIIPSQFIARREYSDRTVCVQEVCVYIPCATLNL